ncbi:unnamed protein product [Microthlaspi erraticum]|uniref:Uncharacterized protein n=1 Tax=Microthlaspi erraticum TaxID=1685480 RepID=A0A6D2KBX1_9BRAS|nr:unnamed protein product [Microthlaspi erraticum]
MSNLILLSESRTSIQGDSLNSKHKRRGLLTPPAPAMRRLGALATFSAHACEGSRSSGITQKLDERLHPGTTVHRGTRFILPSIGLTGAPCQCLVGSHIVIWYHTRPRQLTRLSSESSSLHAQPPRCQSGWALTCENALDYTFLDNMWCSLALGMEWFGLGVEERIYRSSGGCLASWDVSSHVQTHGDLALDPIRFFSSTLASHPLLKLILSPSSWVSLPDRIRYSWSLSTPSLLFSSWCRCPIGLGLLRLHSVAGCCYMIG